MNNKNSVLIISGGSGSISFLIISGATLYLLSLRGDPKQQDIYLMITKLRRDNLTKQKLNRAKYSGTFGKKITHEI